MGHTQWFLVQQPDLTFRFVGESRFGNFRIGRADLPQALPGEVRLVQVILHLEEPPASEVIHIECRRFPVLPSGMRDAASIEWEMTVARDIVGSGAFRQRSAARRRWAKRQQDTVFSWTPTPDERFAIADMVSHRAKQPLLGGRVLHMVRKAARP